MLGLCEVGVGSFVKFLTCGDLIIADDVAPSTFVTMEVSVPAIRMLQKKND